MWHVEFYSESNGREPALEWLKGLEIKQREIIAGKVDYLKEHGLALLGTRMMKRITGDDKDFYELRAGSCRIMLYHDTINDSFMLLHGFLKKRQKESKEIDLARGRLHEYRSRR